MTSFKIAFAAAALAGFAAMTAGSAEAGSFRRGHGIAVGEYHPGIPRHRHGFHFRHGYFGYGAPLLVGSYGAYDPGYDCFLVKRKVFVPGRGFVRRFDRVCG